MKNKVNRTWQKTRTALLWKHLPSGGYYARVKAGGKDHWRSLETDLLSVAKAKLPAVVEELRGASNRHQAPTVEEALKLAAAAKARDPDRAKNTAEYYRYLVPTIVGTFPDPSKRLDRVTDADMKEWHDAHSARYAASRTNGCLSLWRRLFADAKAAGWVARDLSADLKRRRQKQTRLEMPTVEEFARIVEHVRSRNKAHSLAASFTIEFLAYTGLRKVEALSLKWKDITESGIVTRTLKNDDLRVVPIIPACADLMERMKAVCNHRPSDPVVTVIPRHSLSAACKKLRLPHMRIHDLRHLFATRCLESGTPIPTLALWLGHKDGGALCARIYGHVTKAHSAEAAGRVKA